MLRVYDPSHSCANTPGPAAKNPSPLLRFRETPGMSSSPFRRRRGATNPGSSRTTPLMSRTPTTGMSRGTARRLSLFEEQRVSKACKQAGLIRTLVRCGAGGNAVASSAMGCSYPPPPWLAHAPQCCCTALCVVRKPQWYIPFKSFLWPDFFAACAALKGGRRRPQHYSRPHKYCRTYLPEGTGSFALTAPKK